MAITAKETRLIQERKILTMEINRAESILNELKCRRKEIDNALCEVIEDGKHI